MNVSSSRVESPGARPCTQQFVRSRFAPFLTPASLLLLTVLYYSLLLRLPLWVAFVPCVFLAHRVGVMLHEYFHGIALDRYRDNLAVVTLWDGIMMTFGVMETSTATSTITKTRPCRGICSNGERPTRYPRGTTSHTGSACISRASSRRCSRCRSAGRAGGWTTNRSVSASTPVPAWHYGRSSATLSCVSSVILTTRT